ncbi:hypothetical protein PORY_001699 [Pneumocystis oryctolagi]|uniref:Uncharacterized protein n=1 Tax=Pneumocystis oryctolagi TaxID=42067 RepID=A0ACB7CDS5_9ASCO|nr:hypothetical protein PORY_001699 [Pneumocystis oryctolagi]
MPRNLSLMHSEKAVLYERLLDATLCNHQWQVVPELVRKLRKHDIKKHALCEIVLAEARLIHLVESQKNKINEKILRMHFPMAHDVLPVIRIEDLREILAIILKFFDSVDTQHEKLHAHTVLSYVYLLMGDYKCSLNTINPYCEISSVTESSGYCLFNAIKGYAIKGLSHECLSESSLASETYHSMISVLMQIKQEKLPKLSCEWIDVIYYRYSGLLLKSNSPVSVKLDFLNNSIPCIKDELFSTAVYRLYFQLLSELLNKSVYDKAHDNSSSCDISIHDLGARISKVQFVYEKLLMKVVTFPRAGQLNGIILEYVDWVMQNWKNMGKEIDGLEKILETIYNAISKTYKSHRLLRYLMEVLIFLGNYNEARRAFELYDELVEKARVSPFRQENLARRNQLIEEDIGQDFDDDVTIVETYISGIKMNIVYFEDFEKAMVIVKKLLNALDTWEFPKDNKIMGNAWEAIGMTYSCQSIKTHEASERSNIQQNAVNAFQKSLEYMSSNSTLYHLAFQYAEQREITDAISTIKHVVSQKYKLYQSLHLLSLLLSARCEYDQAIQICEAAIQISGIEKNEDYSTFDYEDRECLVEIKLTLCALIEAKDGINVAIEMHKDIFHFYAKVFEVEEFSFPAFDALETKMPSELASSVILDENKGITKFFEKHQASYIFLKRKKCIKNQLSFNTSKRSLSFCSSVSNLDRLYVSKSKNKYLYSNHSDSNIFQIKQSSDDLFQHKASLKPFQSRYYYLKKEQKEISRRCLRKIWLISASLYCRASKWENSQLSLKEAEKSGMFHPDVHTQWGILYYYLNKLDDAARRFEWALLEDHDHINANIGLSKVFLEIKGEMHEFYGDRAEQMLDMVTKLSGWDLSEAWLLLGEIWERMNDLKNAKKAYWYAVELENTRPVRHWRNISPRFIA